MATSSASSLDSYIAQYSAQYGVPEDLLNNQIQVESGGNPNAISSTGAIGYGQLEPATAASLGVNPYNPQQNVQGAAEYDAQLYKQYGNWNSALQAYNEGPTAFNSNGGTTATEQYASDILGPSQPVTGATADNSGSTTGATIGTKTSGCSIGLDPSTWITWAQCEAFNLLFIFLGVVMLIAIIFSMLGKDTDISIPIIPE